LRQKQKYFHINVGGVECTNFLIKYSKSKMATTPSKIGGHNENVFFHRMLNNN